MDEVVRNYLPIKEIKVVRGKQLDNTIDPVELKKDINNFLFSHMHGQATISELEATASALLFDILNNHACHEGKKI